MANYNGAEGTVTSGRCIRGNRCRIFRSFWLKVKDKMVLIRYYALRNPEGGYLGTLEGEKRL